LMLLASSVGACPWNPRLLRRCFKTRCELHLVFIAVFPTRSDYQLCFILISASCSFIYIRRCVWYMAEWFWLMNRWDTTGRDFPACIYL
jgi:hypothetical protein